MRAGFEFVQFARRPEEDAAAVERGKRTSQSVGCAGCHSGQYYTSMRKYNAGTGRGRETGIAFDTPALIEIWRTTPYLHEGRAVTIKRMLAGPDSGIHSLGSRRSASEIDDVTAFVLSL